MIGRLLIANGRKQYKDLLKTFTSSREIIKLIIVPI